MKRIKSLSVSFIFLIVAGVFDITALAQTDFVLKSGDTMTGTLSIESQGGMNDFQPSLRLFGSQDQFKYIRMVNTDSSAIWDLTMDTAADGDSLTFYFSPDGDNWLIPFSIDQSGIMYGNAYGLTNLNIAQAIPDGSITANKVGVEILTATALNDGSIEDLSISSDLSVAGSIVAGQGSTAGGSYSSALGVNSTASGYASHAQGNLTEASGPMSHAEGYSSKAVHLFAHAEGYGTVAAGPASHAEGSSTVASNSCSHAEGYYSKALGTASHAGGSKAVAQHANSFVWSSGDDLNEEFISTTNRQFNVYADNGIRLVPGSSAKVDVEGSMNVTGTISGHFDLSNIGVYGDISMGTFTNSITSN
ncbi:hypothetical protein P4E94_00260 [Pontiellaceae bacterium B12219]|nr:hypothetical protein [Pontiellaceae bacterium B12219]